jgi:WXXGXW repeat (2 copies)
MFYLPLILALAGLIGSGANAPQAQGARGNPPAQPGAQNPAAPVPQFVPQPPLPKPRPADNKNPIDDGGIIIQSRGPIHEAFAQPVELNPTPTTTVPKAPPPAVPELPPGEKPSGANVQWIPGYWGWDPDKNDFLWVSGVWRNAPPDRKWTPGYWNKAGDGWQWISGFWGDAKGKPAYQPQPPDSLEQGPSQPSPNENYFYIPGAWVQQNGAYAWRPGFWYPAQQDWVYVAPNYNYTPAGAIYNDGYWDYPLADRGTAYAPVVFNQPYWTDPGWYYQPTYPLDFGYGFGGPFNNLFVGIGRRHFFYGDFFAHSHFHNGIQPWYAHGARNYDPLFSYYHWANRFNPGWYNGLHNNFWAHADNPALRSAATVGQARGVAARGGLASGAVTPFPAGTAAGSMRGNFMQTTAARQLQRPALARANSERTATPPTGSTSRPAGGPSMISSARTISGNSGRIFTAGGSTAGLSSGAAAGSTVSRTSSSFTRASSTAASRSSINYQSFYSGPSRTAPTPLYQARARQGDAFINSSQLSGGTNIMNGNTSQALNMGRAYMGAYGGSYGARGGAGYSPSMAGYAGHSMGAPSSMGAMHTGGGGVSHGGGGVSHGGGGGGGHGGGHR